MSEQITENTNVIRASRKAVTIYGMGGTGVNITRKFFENKEMRATASQRAMENVAFFDTSIANLHGVPSDKVYLVPDTNGGGSDRSRNAQPIIDSIPEFLNKFQPGDTNIVVFGASGATGSVAGPSLVEALLKRGESVVSVIVAGVETVKACDNAYRTFMGLEMAAKNIMKPIVFTYTATDNRKGSKIDDAYQLKCIAAISALASGRNIRIDAADVDHFFEYTKVTSREPGLALLEVFQLDSEAKLIPSTAFISTATLLKSEETEHPLVEAEYGKVGYFPAPENVDTDGYFFGISTDSLNRKVIQNLMELKKQADSQTSVVNRTQSLFGDKDVSQSSVSGTNLIL